MNIIMGERYKVFPKESKAMLKGEYGQLPGQAEPGGPGQGGHRP